MSIQREARLLITSCKIMLTVLKKDGLNAGSTFIPKLNQLAHSQQQEEAIAATRMINTYRNINGIIYDGKKFGMSHVLKSRFPSVFGTNTTTSLKSLPTNEQSAKVAFVITSLTRQQLGQLGYDEDAIRNMKPKHALDIVASGIPRSVKDQLQNVDNNTSPVAQESSHRSNLLSEATLRKESTKTEIGPPSGGFDMSSVRK
jgi:hypothetical protein